MRVILFFDLPSVTSLDLKAYREFRKNLLLNGFIQMQESVYCKLAINKAAAEATVDKVKTFKPNKGLIQVLTITERQFTHIENILGEFVSTTINSTDRVVFV